MEAVKAVGRWYAVGSELAQVRLFFSPGGDIFLPAVSAIGCARLTSRFVAPPGLGCP